jgi:hypothetical protein
MSRHGGKGGERDLSKDRERKKERENQCSPSL